LNNVKSEIFNLYYGNVIEIAERFAGVQELRDAVNQLQSLLYSA